MLCLFLVFEITSFNIRKEIATLKRVLNFSKVFHTAISTKNVYVFPLFPKAFDHEVA